MGSFIPQTSQRTAGIVTSGKTKESAASLAWTTATTVSQKQKRKKSASATDVPMVGQILVLVGVPRGF